jgi:hypothetical protein
MFIPIGYRRRVDLVVVNCRQLNGYSMIGYETVDDFQDEERKYGEFES